MLVLSRKVEEEIMIEVPPSNKVQMIRMQVVEIRGTQVRVGFEASREAVTIHRKEVWDAIQREHNRG